MKQKKSDLWGKFLGFAKPSCFDYFKTTLGKHKETVDKFGLITDKQYKYF